MKTPITYYGGKQTMVKYLLSLIPPHKLYCEPFFGGGALFFAKPKSEVEVINDTNGEVVNFFRMVKSKFSELQKEVRSSLHSRELYRRAWVVYQNPDMFSDVKRAWAFWILTNQGFAGRMGSWAFAKDCSIERNQSRKREEFTKDYADRLNTVQIENNDALKVIDRCDEKQSFFYVDPPYINSNQGHYKGYTEEDYTRLLERLGKLKGKFLLSSYPSAVLKKFRHRNKWHSMNLKKHVSVTKLTDKIKTEMLVCNYDPVKTGTFESVAMKQLTQNLQQLKFAA